MSKPSRLPSPKKVASKTPILRDVNYLNKQHNLKEDERKEAQKWLTKVIVWSVAIVAIISIVALYIMGNINQDSTPDKETQAEIHHQQQQGLNQHQQVTRLLLLLVHTIVFLIYW